MNTKLIGIKKFRQDFTSIWKEAKAKNIRYIVMHHSVPVLEVNPINEEDMILEKLVSDVDVARKQAKNNKVYAEDEVYKKLKIE